MVPSLGGHEETVEEGGRPSDGSASDAILRDCWYNLKVVFMENDRNLKACCSMHVNKIHEIDIRFTNVKVSSFACAGETGCDQLQPGVSVWNEVWVPAGAFGECERQSKHLLEEPILEV